MRDDNKQARIIEWIDAWMAMLNDKAKEYVAQGMSPEQAVDKATYDIRMMIRRAPPIDLD